MAKPQMLPPAQLNEVEQRLSLVPRLQTALESDAAFELSIGSPHFHERDGRGRSWNITGFRSGFVFWPQCHAEFRFIVDRTRERYDMA